MKDEVAQKIMDDTPEDYDKIAEQFSNTREYPWGEFKNLSANVRDGDSILDAGCGNGRLLDVLKERRINYVGVDNSPELIKIAAKRYPQYRFLLGNIMSLPADKAKFDLIFCIATFHHIPGKKFQLQALAEMKRTLKPGGQLIMLNWNYFQADYWPIMLRRAVNKLLGKYSLGWRDVMRPWKNTAGEILTKRYIRAFTPGEMRGLLKKSGLQLVQQYYTKKGRRTSWLSGFNLITIARKS